jgi:hypothetical protein
MSTSGGEIWIPPVPALPDVGAITKAQEKPGMPGFSWFWVILTGIKKGRQSPDYRPRHPRRAQWLAPVPIPAWRPWSLATLGARKMTQEVCQLRRLGWRGQAARSTDIAEPTSRFARPLVVRAIDTL